MNDNTPSQHEVDAAVIEVQRAEIERLRKVISILVGVFEESAAALHNSNDAIQRIMSELQ